MIHIIYLIIILYTVLSANFLYELYDLEDLKDNVMKYVIFIILVYLYTPFFVFPATVTNIINKTFHIKVWFLIYFTKTFKNLTEEQKDDVIKRLARLEPSDKSIKSRIYKKTLIKVCKLNKIDYTEYINQ